MCGNRDELASALVNVRDQPTRQHHRQGNHRWRRPDLVEILLGSARNLRAQGLRWASDYDARRPRLILIQNSSEFNLGAASCSNVPDFWTGADSLLARCASDGVTIRNNRGPAKGADH